MESASHYKLPKYPLLLCWRRMSFTARQHPSHPQGTVIWHLTCSRASLDPAGEHPKLFLPGRVLIQSCSALLVINSYFAARVQGKSAQVLWGQGEDLMIPLCWNWLSRNEHQPWAADAVLGTWGSQTDWHQPPSPSHQRNSRWLRAVIVPSGRLLLLSTLRLGELANWHLVHYRANLIWHYWFPEA